MTQESRRDFLKTSSVAAGTFLLSAGSDEAPRPAVGGEAGRTEKTVNVVVWDEQQPAQKQAYPTFLGNAIAANLKSQPGFSVKSVNPNEPEQGLSSNVLGDCDVLIWWGHARQAEITPQTGRKLVERIKAGTLAMIALHSAHWSTPFVEAMNERTRLDLERMLRIGDKDRIEIQEIAPPSRYTVPKADARITPHATLRKFPDGLTKAVLQLPYCCFPAYRNDGKPSVIRVLKSDHPIVAGIAREFELPQTEMYNEPFHVPEPDEVILEERWASGDWFRSGMVWKLGKGRVFYF
jgi:trehalose utilization protein